MGDERLDGTGAFLSTTELRAWTALVDASRIIDTELHRDLVDHHGMTHREYEVLVRLDGAGGSMRMSVLASQIEASAALLSQTVTRLEDRGWVDRHRVSGDRRGVAASLTHAGAAALRRAAEPHAVIIRRLLIEGLGDDLDSFGDALGRVADHLRSHRRADGCGDPTCYLSD